MYDMIEMIERPFIRPLLPATNLDVALGSFRTSGRLGAIIPPSMDTLRFTDQQRDAVRTADRSVIVSAAAGSGKTAVLTARCAYLVCDAPPQERCDIDELLVLTFTDAAAAEMRTRIVAAVAKRAQHEPGNRRLDEQLARVGSAKISTINAFCLWVVRRWFEDAGVEPTVAVLDVDEVVRLQRDTLQELFAGLYDSTESAATASATPDAADQEQSARSAKLKADFQRLVDVYGLGEDGVVAEFIFKLYGFTTSLPDPDQWLHQAHVELMEDADKLIDRLALELADELAGQISHCVEVSTTLHAAHSAGHFHAGVIEQYGKCLEQWQAQLSDKIDIDNGNTSAVDRFEYVRSSIAAYSFAIQRAPSLDRDADDSVAEARKRATDEYKIVREKLFKKRLQSVFALFSVDECLEAARQTAPFVETIVELVRQFRDLYTKAKRRLNGLDFADVERLAFNLLHEDGDLGRPSAIAKSLQQRFRYVLVDEFQDINPIQEAILRLTSREYDANQADNLFVVGDVKQSIYRFRLAEPNIFLSRLESFRKDDNSRKAIDLQANFRSRRIILDAVNLLFSALMRSGVGRIIYDDQAMLHPGAVDQQQDERDHPPVELHLLEGNPHQQADDSAPPLETAGWSTTEYEACLIGTRIRALLSTARGQDGSPVHLRDMVILVRAAKTRAQRMATVLTGMGIPTHCDASGAFFASREVRDVLAALEIIDNLHQDIPLAAVLRSGMFAEPLTEDQLVRVRLLDRELAFHAVVRAYATQGADEELRRRLHAVLDSVRQCRRDARCRPLASVLWNLLHDRGYLCYAAGLPGGTQRQANLLKLHKITRQFGSFRRQGLHRFLRFVHMLQERNSDQGAAPTLSEADDAVRIMSIHQSKGLEYPIVFVAGLGTRFNLGDRSGRMIFERQAHIGLRAIDTERMIEYPTVSHRLAAMEIERATRQEEMRILYVALTRAKHRLILVGTMKDLQNIRDDVSREPHPEPSIHRTKTAATALDWILPSLQAAPKEHVTGLNGSVAHHPLFEVTLHAADTIAGWSPKDQDSTPRSDEAQEIELWGPLPCDEPMVTQDPEVERVLARIDDVYPYLSSSSIRAAVAASQWRHGSTETGEPGQIKTHHRAMPGASLGEANTSASRRTATDRGTVTHRVLQHLDFQLATNLERLERELQRLVQDGLIHAAEMSSIDVDSLAWFITTDLAQALRSAGSHLRREFMFSALEPLNLIDSTTDAPADDQVLVRGVVDAILPVAEDRQGTSTALGRIDIVDYKTDAVSPADVATRVDDYRSQMELYARAMQRVWKIPVRTAWLVFLTPRCIVALDDCGNE